MKISIVGKSATAVLSPMIGSDWELWGLPWGNLPMDVYFDPHTPEYMSGVLGKEYVEKLSSLDKPIYMQKHYEEIPESIEYPLTEMIDTFGDYFQSSVSYMLALAITKNPETIGFYGVDLNIEIEYKNQRHNIEYLLGFAKCKGIEVFIPKMCAISKYEQQFIQYPQRYGWE